MIRKNRKFSLSNAGEYFYKQRKEYLKTYDMKYMAWYPLGYGAKYNKSSVQIILRWHIQMGHVVIPRAAKEEHIKANIDILDFKLTDEDM